MLRSPSDSGVKLMGQLAFRLAPAVTRLPGSSYATRISTERLDVLDADVIIAHYASTAARADLEESPMFLRLGAVRLGAYLAFDTAPFIAVRMPSPLSIPYGLDHLIPALERAAPSPMRT